jgi:hypothetical protein
MELAAEKANSAPHVSIPSVPPELLEVIGLQLDRHVTDKPSCRHCLAPHIRATAVLQWSPPLK